MIKCLMMLFTAFCLTCYKLAPIPLCPKDCSQMQYLKSTKLITVHREYYLLQNTHHTIDW